MDYEYKIDPSLIPIQSPSRVIQPTPKWYNAKAQRKNPLRFKNSLRQGGKRTSPSPLNIHLSTTMLPT